MQTLYPRGKSQGSERSRRILTYRSATVTFLMTAISNATAISATSSEKTPPAPATWIPRRRHSWRSMWSVPTLEVTTRLSEGRRLRTSVVMEYVALQIMAGIVDGLWLLARMNCCSDRPEGLRFRKLNLWE